MKILAFDFNNILVDVRDELIKRGHTLLDHRDQWREADVIVVWHETDISGAKNWVIEMQQAGKKVVLVQHGRRGTSRIYPPFNEKLQSDVVCVWGENDVARLVSCGVPRERIVVTGTPVVKRVRSRKPHTGINVVFSPEHWDQEVVENAMVAGALRKIPGINIITKVLENEHNIWEYDNPVISNRQALGHLDICMEVLEQADIVVGISESTFELLAEIMDIPVVIADIWIPKACAGDDRYKEYQREYSNACERVKHLSDLGSVIQKHLRNPHLLREERRTIGILDGGSNITDPITNIIDVITKTGSHSTQNR